MGRTHLSPVCLALLLLAAGTQARELLSGPAPSLPDGQPYDTGSPPRLLHLWVDPVAGSDSNSGASQAEALRTFTAAWGRIPPNRRLKRGRRIHILPGEFAEGQAPIYWENRFGRYKAPIIIEAVTPGTVTFPAINVYNCKFLYFINVRVEAGGGDVFHCELCKGLLLRGVTLRGTNPPAVDETVKLNQCKGVFIEDCTINGARDNAVDMVAVQYGHVLRSDISNSDWCMYFKGGSAYLLVAGNTIHQCGSSGFNAGQGTGFEYMVPKWLRYEAYDIRVVNNVIHDVEGAGLGVYGGYRILLAYNTLFRVGSRSHVLEAKLGDRSCDVDEERQFRCGVYQAAGGWGPSDTAEASGVKIPSKEIMFANNLVYNPAGFQSQWQHFQVDGPLPSNCPTCTALPATAVADNGLIIRGNVIWNGPASMHLGLGESTGCQDSNPTCTAALLAAQNDINTLLPQLMNPEGGDFRPQQGGSLVAYAKLWAIPPWGAWRGGLATPPGASDNGVGMDFNGAGRGGASNTVGAFVVPVPQG